MLADYWNDVVETGVDEFVARFREVARGEGGGNIGFR